MATLSFELFQAVLQL